MLNLQTELKDIETLKDMIIANKARAINSKETYLDSHGVVMPYYLRMVVDGNYRTSEALLNNSSFLLDEIKELQEKYNLLKEHAENLEDILMNGPEAVETKISNEVKQEPKHEYTELELKQLSTDGRLD